MNPRLIDEMGWRMAEVYGAVTDRLLINLARHFKFISQGAPVTGGFEYMVRKLAEMGQVTRESEAIILESLGGADEALQTLLEEAIRDGLKDVDPVLRKAAEKGLLFGQSLVPELAPNQMNAFKFYYNQSADKLNLVNTVMLESTQQAYQATVSDIANRINATQGILNTKTGEVITGVTPINKAIKDGVSKMVENGLTGFIDHGGHHWSPEAYVEMDIRTTMANTARAAVFERNEQFGVDLYQVSSHAGARPLCYPWQGKVLSRSGWTGEVKDDEGNPVQVHSQDEVESFNYGGGLFGVNCGHHPIPFIPGFSRIRPPQQDEEQNKKEYEESQEQRRLERNLRNEKRELEVMKAQGASDEEIKAQKLRVKNASTEIDDFCKETGRARLRSRESAPINASFPDDYQQTRYGRKNAPEKPSALEQKVEKVGIDPNTLGQYPYKPEELPSTPGSLNVYGEEIKIDERIKKESKEMINNLSTEFKTRLREVRVGTSKVGVAGSVDNITGTVMHLSSKKDYTVIHEFAHTISTTNATKYNYADDTEFWKEMRSLRTQYRKAIRNNPNMKISLYADIEQDINEFAAEGFALGYMREHGVEIPKDYGNDTYFSAKVLEIFRKYFAK